MKEMPAEIKLLIFSFLRNKQSLARVSQVSREWNEIAKQDVLWSPFLFKDKIVTDAKEKYRKALKFSKMKVLYYTCTGSRENIAHNYRVPFDYNFGEEEKNPPQIQFYTPRAIGCGTHLGAHADIIRLLNTVNCIVINVIQDGHQRFGYYLNNLLKIGDRKITDIPMLKAPKLINGFPNVPIVVVTDPAFIATIKQQSKLNNIEISEIVSGKLKSYHSKSDLEDEEIKTVWLNVRDAILSASIPHNQEALKEGHTCKCSIQ